MNARLIAIALLALSLVAAKMPGVAAPAGAPEKRLSTFPTEFEGWTGKDDPFDAKVMQVVDTDDDLHRLYKKDGQFVWLYVGYYGTKKGGRTGHLPHHCYPAAGYRIMALGKVPVKGPDGKELEVNHILLERGGKMTSALYWIHSGEHQILTDGWMMNLTRLRRRLLNGRDDGALVRVSAPVSGSVEETIKRQTEFTENFLKKVPYHWPLEVPAENL